MIYFEFSTTDGGQFCVSAQDVASALGIDLIPGADVKMICEDGGNRLIVAGTNANGPHIFPHVEVSRDTEGSCGLISVTELPNEDNAHVSTFLYAGNDETETDDWLACISDGVREGDDESRRMMYADKDLVCVGDAREMPDPIPYTENQHNTAIRKANTNSCIYYTYRDGGNYKTHNCAVIRGVLTEEQKKIIIDSLGVDKTFVPDAVGLPEERFSEWDPEFDHAYFEFDDFGEVESKPTVDLTADDLVAAFARNADHWEQLATARYEELSQE